MCVYSEVQEGESRPTLSASKNKIYKEADWKNGENGGGL